MSDGYQAVLDFYRQRGYEQKLGPGQRPAVLVIDFSLAFTASADTFPGGNFAAELSQTKRILQAARSRVPIYFTTISYDSGLQDAGFWLTKVPWLECCVENTEAVKIDPCLEAREDEAVIVKKFPSALYETDLVSRLTSAGVDTLIIAGCTTSVCVRATALDAMQHGYRPIIAREAVGDFVPEVHEIHLLDIGSRYADVWPVDDVCAYLEGLAGSHAS
jgi:nicotinamidase-related amidase